MMSDWTVTRVWRGVRARTATEAIDASKGPHDDVNVRIEGGASLAQLYYTLDEIKALEIGVALSIEQNEGNRTLARSPQIRTMLDEQSVLLSSLRTSLAEARYGLEREQAAADLRP